MAYALAQSLNSIAIQILDYAGVSRAVDVAHALGIQSKLDANLSLALGTSVVTPLELATAYNTISQLGEYHTTYVIDHINDGKKNSLYKFIPFEGKQVVKREDVAALTMMMTGGCEFRNGYPPPISDGHKPAKPAPPKITAMHGLLDLCRNSPLLPGWGNDDNAKMKKGNGWQFPRASLVIVYESARWAVNLPCPWRRKASVMTLRPRSQILVMNSFNGTMPHPNRKTIPPHPAQPP